MRAATNLCEREECGFSFEALHLIGGKLTNDQVDQSRDCALHIFIDESKEATQEYSDSTLPKIQFLLLCQERRKKRIS
jgi:hypothetical protein